MPYYFQAGEGALWAQIYGPNTSPVYLGCHQLGDVDEPQGDIDLIYCQDASAPNRFKVVGSTQGAAGAVTTTVTAAVADELDYLERVKCPFTLFAHMVDTGRKDVFTNYKRSFVLVNARVTSRGLTNMVARTPDDNGRSDQTFDLSSEYMLRVVQLSINRQSISETSAINDINACAEERCRTSDTPAQLPCQVLYAVTDAPTGSPTGKANVLVTTNGGSWAATAANPFDAGEDIAAVECFELGRDERRIVVVRGTTDVSHPMEIAYSDDAGVTWTNVDVGSINGEFISSPHGMFALDRNNIWLATNLGNIYHSDSAGLDWDLIESGVITSNDWLAINFVSENVGWVVGEQNVIARTVDGGVSWSVVTGPSAQTGQNAQALAVLDRNRAWVGYDNGKLYFTNDEGDNWEERAFSGSGVGQVKDISFWNGDMLGYLVVNNASPIGKVLRTINGGYDWESLTTPTNSGLNTISVCDQWGFFVVGERNSAKGYIAQGGL